MVVLHKIYTRTGDAGDTALADGTRVAKHDPRVETYGTVDELNATVGMARVHAGAELATRLGVIQNELFDLGADLSRPGMASEDRERPVLRILPEQVERLEHEINAMNAPMPPLRSFVLPAGTQLAVHLHLARTVARRAERRATELATGGGINPSAVIYLNRLSDWLFVAARAANGGTSGDVLWVPGGTRDESGA